MPGAFPNYPKIPPGSQNCRESLLLQPVLCGHSWANEELCVTPSASPGSRAQLLLWQVTHGALGTPQVTSLSPHSDGSPRQLQASCMSRLWGSVTHDVPHLGLTSWRWQCYFHVEL